MVPVGAMSSYRVSDREFVFEVPVDGHDRKLRIPAGATVFLPQVIPNMNPHVFEDPETFNPDRWANPTKAMKESLMMFSYGKRGCIGQSLAKAELNTVLPLLLSKFKFDVEKTGELDFFLSWKYHGTLLKASHF